LPFKLILLTNIQANYWWGQMHCGPPNQNFGWALGPRYTLQRPPMYWSWQTIKNTVTARDEQHQKSHQLNLHRN